MKTNLAITFTRFRNSQLTRSVQTTCCTIGAAYVGSYTASTLFKKEIRFNFAVLNSNNINFLLLLFESSRVKCLKVKLKEASVASELSARDHDKSAITGESWLYHPFQVKYFAKCCSAVLKVQ